MELNTRCPECGTVFPASLEQMKLRKGYIRCVNCANIFDGFDSVVSGDEPGGADQLAVVRPVSARVPPRVDLHSIGPDDDLPAINLSNDEAADPSPVSLYVEPRNDRIRRPAGSEFLTHRRSVVSSSWSGLIALLLLLAVLAGAALTIYAYRVQVASSLPAARPLLERVCESLGCTVPYPQRIDRISIMDSSLQAGEEESIMQLNVVMRNTFDKAQQWPVLMLDLVDFSGAVVASRAVGPVDYLSRDAQAQPFRAGEEVRLEIPVNVEGLKVNGYQLRKVFPEQGSK